MTNNISSQDLNKDAYLTLSNGNYATLEEATDEYLNVLSEDEGDDFDPEAMRGVLMATMNFLHVQRKLDKWLQDNVPAPTGDVVDYSVEVAERLGLNTTVSVGVTPEQIDYKELFDILFPSK